MSETTQSLKDTLAILLAELQWSTYDPSCFDLAFKEYHTAAGVQIARAYLSPVSDISCIAMLKADYQVEGVNVLSTIWYPIPTDLSEEALMYFIERFNAEVDERIADDYAMRLTRPCPAEMNA
jgi:hypothetical protein